MLIDIFSNLTSYQTESNDDEEIEEEDLVSKTSILYLVAYSGVMLFVISLGVTGNILNLLVFRFGSDFKGVTYSLFRALAVADLCAMLLWIPETLRLGFYIYQGNFPYRSTAWYYAHISFPLINIFILAGSLLVLAVSFERFVAICLPLQVKRVGVGRHLKLIIVCCFLFPSIMYTPSAWEYTVEPAPGLNHTYYYKHWNTDYADSIQYRAYKWIRVSVLRFLPIVFIVILNSVSACRFRAILKHRAQLRGRVSRKSRTPRVAAAFQTPIKPAENEICVGDRPSLYRSPRAGRLSINANKERGRENDGCHESHVNQPKNSASKSEKDEERSKTFLMIGVAVQFVVCMTPVAVYHTIVDEDLRATWSFRVFTSLADILDLANSAFNFYTYALASQQFRLQFKRVICRVRGNRRGDILGNTTLHQEAFSMAR